MTFLITKKCNQNPSFSLIKIMLTFLFIKACSRSKIRSLEIALPPIPTSFIRLSSSGRTYSRTRASAVSRFETIFCARIDSCDFVSETIIHQNKD